jgi:hypothetical protein
VSAGYFAKEGYFSMDKNHELELTGYKTLHFDGRSKTLLLKHSVTNLQIGIHSSILDSFILLTTEKKTKRRTPLSFFR